MKRRKTRSPKKPTIRTKRPLAPLAPFDPKQLQELSERVETRQLRSEDYQALMAIYDSLLQFVELARQEGTTVQQLRELVWDASDKPTEAVADDGTNRQTLRNGDSSSVADA